VLRAAALCIALGIWSGAALSQGVSAPAEKRETRKQTERASISATPKAEKALPSPKAEHRTPPPRHREP
jgi:Flp pilus assembly protein TadD